jgi:hypothetical protein
MESINTEIVNTEIVNTEIVLPDGSNLANRGFGVTMGLGKVAFYELAYGFEEGYGYRRTCTQPV